MLYRTSHRSPRSGAFRRVFCFRSTPVLPESDPSSPARSAAPSGPQVRCSGPFSTRTSRAARWAAATSMRASSPPALRPWSGRSGRLAWGRTGSGVGSGRGARSQEPNHLGQQGKRRLLWILWSATRRHKGLLGIGKCLVRTFFPCELD